MGQFVGCLQGIGEAARALDFPDRLRQCLALQRDDGRRDSADALDRRRRARGRCRARPRARVQARGRRDPADRRRARLARPLGLARDLPRPRGGRAAAGRSRRGAAQRRIRARADRGRRASARVHDISDGGLAVALAEMAIAGGIGATIDAAAVEGPAHAFFFGEDQGRYVVTAPHSDCEGADRRGRARGRSRQAHRRDRRRALTLPGEAPIAVDDSATRRSKSWFPAFMDGQEAFVTETN